MDVWFVAHLKRLPLDDLKIDEDLFLRSFLYIRSPSAFRRHAGHLKVLNGAMLACAQTATGLSEAAVSATDATRY